MATPLAHSRRGLPDAELARLAGAGDGEAFAELYDRHEQRVYGFCMRLLCSPHDAAEATQDTFVRLLGRLPALAGRELNFVAYTLASARNACYDMIGSRRTVEPVADSPEPRGPQEGQLERDPERFALLEATREEVRAANAALPARQREVLALREVELLSYEEIGELMGLNRNAVAQLISRARIKLGELLRGGALASLAAATEECERALGLLAALQDAQEEEAGPLEWVREHLAGCETCRVSRTAMEEAGLSYRALGPLVPLVWLRQATIARAAEAVGADWSHLLSGHAVGAGPSTATATPHSQSGTTSSRTRGGGESGSSTPHAGGRPSADEAGRASASAPGSAGQEISALVATRPGGTPPRARGWAALLASGSRGRALGVFAAALLCVVLVLAGASEIAREGQAPVHTRTLARPTVTVARTHQQLGKVAPTPRAPVHTVPLALATDTGTTPVSPTPLTSSGGVVRKHADRRRGRSHRRRHQAAASPTPPPSVTTTAPATAPPAAPPTTTTSPTPAPTTTTPPPTETTGTTGTTGTPPTEEPPPGGGLIP